jgi:hypothetical protein
VDEIFNVFCAMSPSMKAQSASMAARTCFALILSAAFFEPPEGLLRAKASKVLRYAVFKSAYGGSFKLPAFTTT